MRLLALTDGQITSLALPSTLIAAAETAVRTAESSGAGVPHRAHMHWQDNTLLSMPAVAEPLLGIKVVSVIPSNAMRGLPVVQGFMVLQDALTGVPLALMNAAALTAQRTGAVGALGIKYTTPPDVSSVGIVGCGVQGAWQAVFACAVRPIKEVFCFARSEARRAGFTATVHRHAPSARITFCADADTLLSCTEVIIAATTSVEPVLPNESSRLQGKHFVSIGSFKPTMQELPDEVYRLAGELIIDSQAARHEAGDVVNVVARKILGTEKIFTLGAVITGERTVDVSRTTAFKSVGMALFDLYVANALYQEARRQHIGQEIEL
jgi:ornithine cyclodeaminase/alanine dehydrogenase-like protein (mu-crystallin family)